MVIAATLAMLPVGTSKAQERTTESANQFLDLFARAGGLMAKTYSDPEPDASQINAARGQARRITLVSVYDTGGRTGCVSAFEDDRNIGLDVFWENVVRVELVRWGERRGFDDREYYPFVLVEQVRRDRRSYYVFYPDRTADLDRLYITLNFLHQNCSALTATGF